MFLFKATQYAYSLFKSNVALPAKCYRKISSIDSPCDIYF